MTVVTNRQESTDGVSCKTVSGASSFNLDNKTGKWHDDFIDFLNGDSANNKFGDRPRVNLEVLGAIPLRLYFIVGLTLTIAYGVMETYPGSYKWGCRDECGRSCNPDTAEISNPLTPVSESNCSYSATGHVFEWTGFVDVESYSYDVLLALGLDSMSDSDGGDEYYNFQTLTEISYYDNTQYTETYKRNFELECHGTDCAWVLVRGIPVGSRTGRWYFHIIISPTDWNVTKLQNHELYPRVVALHQKPAYTQAEAALRIILIFFVLHQLPYFLWKNFGRSSMFSAWLTEQIWVAFGLLFLLCYLNPMFLPAILHREETGATGVAYRVFEVFFSKVYYAYLMAILSLIPVHIALQDERRMWVLLGTQGFFVPSALVILLLTAFIILSCLSFADRYDDVTYNGAMDRNDKYGLATLEVILTWTWIAVIVLSLIVCRYRLKKAVYTKSRLRVLSFRAYLLFPVPCITAAVCVRIYRYYNPTPLINVIANASEGIPSILISSIFMLFLSYLYVPTYSPRMFSPPPPHQQAWIHWSWSEDWQLWWRQYGKSMYFFTLEEEVKIFEDKQTEQVKQSSRDYIETLFEKHHTQAPTYPSMDSPKHAIVRFRDLMKKGERVSSKDRDPNITQTVLLSELFQKNDRRTFKFSFLKNSAPNEQLLLSRSKRLDPAALSDLSVSKGSEGDMGDAGSSVSVIKQQSNANISNVALGVHGVDVFRSMGDIRDIPIVSPADVELRIPEVLPENPVWKVARAMRKRTSVFPEKIRGVLFNEDTTSRADAASSAATSNSSTAPKRQLTAGDMHIFCWESAVECVNASWLAYLDDEVPEKRKAKNDLLREEKKTALPVPTEAPFTSSNYLKTEKTKTSYITWYADYGKVLQEYRDPGGDDPNEITIKHERCDLYIKGIREMQNSSMGEFRWSEVFRKGGGTEDVLLDPDNGKILSQRTTQDWSGLWAMDLEVHIRWVQTMLFLDSSTPDELTWKELTHQLKQHLHAVPSTLILDSTWGERDVIDDDEYELRRAFIRGQVWVMCNLPHHLDYIEDDDNTADQKSDSSETALSPNASIYRKESICESTMESEDVITDVSTMDESMQHFINTLYNRCDNSGSVHVSSSSDITPPGRVAFQINKLVSWAHEHLRCTTGTFISAVRLLVLQGVVEQQVSCTVSCDGQLYYFSKKFIPTEVTPRKWTMFELRKVIEFTYPSKPPLTQPTYEDDTVPIHAELYGYRLEATVKADELNLKAIILSCPSKVILSFRGTDNNENVWLDFKLWQGNVDSKNSWDAFMAAVTKRARRLRTGACGCQRTNNERVFGSNGSVARCLLSCKRTVTCSAEQIKCHQGFIEAWAALEDSIFQVLSTISPQTDPRALFFTGHSLGGAIAQLAAINIVTKLYKNPRTVRVYSLSSPRVGNINFSATYNYHVPHSFRLVVDGDPVTNVPFAISGYHHAGTEVHLGRSETTPSWVIAPHWLDKGAFPYPRTTSHLMYDISRAVNMILKHIDWNFLRFNSALSPPKPINATSECYSFPWFRSSEPHRVIDVVGDDCCESDHCPDRDSESDCDPDMLFSPLK